MKGTTLSWRDLVSEAVSGLASRPTRTLLTVAGTVLGIAALVATLGLAQTASNRIVGTFSELEATSVVVTNEGGYGGAGDTRAAFPEDHEDRLSRLNGVNAVGALGEINIEGATVSTVALDDPAGQDAHHLSVIAASPGLLAAVQGTMGAGRWFDAGHETRADNVVVLGPGAANRLGVFRVDQQPVVFIGKAPFVVIGVLDDVARQASMLDAVIMPEGTARRSFDYTSADTVQIDVLVGAGELIAEQAPISLNPNAPETFSSRTAPSPESMRNRVQSDTNALFLVLGAVSLVVGTIGIANVTLVSVLERVGEIGLRRAVGARPRHVATQFLLESTTMGLAGGVIGATIGILIVVGVSAFQQWTPVLSPLIPVGAPLLGVVTGLVAGVYPALRAASLEPVDALRAGT